MTTSEAGNESTARHLHRYVASSSWSGTTGVGYEEYKRNHTVRAPNVETPLDLSSDRAFHGDPSRLNPEVLLVVAASSCQMLSFLAVAARARLDVVAYEDEAEGEMPDQREPTGLTCIRLHPVVTVRRLPGKQTDAELSGRLQHLSEVAHRECFIANSLRTPVEIAPRFVFVE